MNTPQFEQLFSETVADVLTLARSKGKDYSSEYDRLSNFKNQAANLGLTEYQVWAVYANKHWDAINAFVRNDGQLESEPIESRIQDIIVYSILLLGLIQDRKDQFDPEIARLAKELL